MKSSHLLVILCIALVAASVPVLANKLYPCAFVETINITGSQQLQEHNNNETIYMHDDVIIPSTFIATYDFVMQQSERVPVAPHLRACVCQERPCIRFCCQPGHIYDIRSRRCHMAGNLSAPLGYDMELQWPNGSIGHVEARDQFSLQFGAPCDHMRFVTKDSKVLKWSLFPNGTIARKNHVFSRQYCFTSLRTVNDTWEWQPLACTAEKLRFVLGVMEWTYAISLIITVICFVLVLFIYVLCNELRNTFYGVAIQAYALSMILGYSLLAHLTLTEPAHLPKIVCVVMPSLVLLFLLLSFYILSYISFNFYLHFNGIVLTKWMFWLIFVPIVILAIGWSIFVSFDHYGNKTVLGHDPCWFDPRNWSIMVYLYTPILISFAISGFFYVLTLIQLNESPETERKKLTAGIEGNRFGSFWKYFAYNFAAWLAFIVVFIVNYYHREKTHISYGGCFFVMVQGFGALHALIGKNRQVQTWLRRIENDVDDCEDDCETSVPMTNF